MGKKLVADMLMEFIKKVEPGVYGYREIAERVGTKPTYVSYILSRFETNGKLPCNVVYVRGKLIKTDKCIRGDGEDDRG